MKKTKVIFSIFFIFILIFSTKSYADTPKISLLGQVNVDTNTTEEIIVKLSGDDTIGVIEGVLKVDSNIEIIEFSANDSKWTLTYNDKTGKFNSVYAYGTTDGEILKIKYKLKTGAEKGNITFSNLALTTIEYNKIELGEVSTTITAKKQSTDNGDKDDEPEVTPGNTIPKNTTDDQKKSDTEKNQETNNTPSKASNNEKDIEKNNEVINNQNPKKEIPQLGQTRSILIVIGIFGILSLFIIRKYIKLRQIK